VNSCDDKAAFSRGLAESARWGTATIGDIAGVAGSQAPVAPFVPRVVSFLELLGLSRERAQAELRRADEHLSKGTTATCGLSPHAPYSVRADLFRDLVDLAVRRRAPLAMHLAESRAELELLARGTGEFVPFLKEVGVWDSELFRGGVRPLDFLRELARVERALVVHGNYLAADEIDFLAEHPQISVVYCPRTHSFFRHDPHPWRELIARNVNVALGTDSRASNPDLGLWNELLYLRELAPGPDPALLLGLGTSNGALALGLARETGSLAEGKSADLAVVELADGDSTDPYALLFRAENRIAAVMIAGLWLPGIENSGDSL